VLRISLRRLKKRRVMLESFRKMLRRIMKSKHPKKLLVWKMEI
jgi:hypothetical protein